VTEREATDKAAKLDKDIMRLSKKRAIMRTVNKSVMIYVEIGYELRRKKEARKDIGRILRESYLKRRFKEMNPAI